MTSFEEQQQISMHNQLFQQLDSSSSGGIDENSHPRNTFIIPAIMDNPNRSGTPDRIYTTDQVRENIQIVILQNRP
jgi:hypothetical protein